MGDHNRFFWFWGTAHLLDKRSVLYKLHGLSVADTLGSMAIICFNQAIRSDQNYAFAENNLGLVLQMQDKLGDAVVNFQEAIRKNPNYPEAHFNLGNVLQLQGKTEEAIAYFQTAIKLNPKYIKAYNSLALALGRQDKVEAAMSVFKQALAIQPNSPEAFACLFSMKEMTCNWETREADLIQLWQLTENQLQEGKSTAVTPFDSLYKPWSASQQLKVACNYAQEIKRQLALGTKPLNFNHSRTVEPVDGRLQFLYPEGNGKVFVLEIQVQIVGNLAISIGAVELNGRLVVVAVGSQRVATL